MADDPSRFIRGFSKVVLYLGLDGVASWVLRRWIARGKRRG